MHFEKPYDELTLEEQRLFDAEVEEDYQKEMAGPRRITVYSPSARMDMESIFSPSDDVHHPNYRGR